MAYRQLLGQLRVYKPAGDEGGDRLWLWRFALGELRCWSWHLFQRKLEVYSSWGDVEVEHDIV